MSIADQHAEWLSLVETSGPFLTVPTLKRALPAGLEGTPRAMSALRVAHAEWREDPGLKARWVRWVLDELLGLDGRVAEPNGLAHRVPEHGVTLRPDYVVEGDRGPVLLVCIERPRADGWAAGAVDRAAVLARAANVELALVTDGDRWTLVWARANGALGTCAWRSDLWLEEPVTLRAFVTLLGARRFFALPDEETLPRLLAMSADQQQEVTDRLGTQVRRAVELLISTLDREDRDRHGDLLGELEGEKVYRGAVTVMMRLVFLFVAEERRLLPVDAPRYAETLAASTLRAQLQERADRYGEDPLEKSTAGWHRLLALFRAVHGGVEHDALRLLAYGGGLFDPDRFPFLEGRAAGTTWRATGADPLPVDDRTLLHLLDALQTLDQGGRDGARVRLSFRALDVEQIGHIYEGLLDHTAIRISDSALGLAGKHEPEIALSELEALDDDAVAAATGRSAKAIRKALDAEVDEEAHARTRAACDNDDALAARVLPFVGLCRRDLRGDPEVFLGGSLFVTQALDRRASGTYYTPRSLAEEVVQHALDPVVYSPGPAETADRDAWRLRGATELLELKVADIAMGSGAFLVAACRYLAARLREAWGDGAPVGPQEREAHSLRLVAERCLYGVDKNPMAVEMAKLSLWLITLAKDRSFSFVDHALRAGDSLVGIDDLRQLRTGHVDPGQGRLSTELAGLDRSVDAALALRRELEAEPTGVLRDASRKAALLGRAEAAVANLALIGDLVVGAAIAREDEAFDDGRADLVRSLDGAARTELRAVADSWLARRDGSVRATQEVSFEELKPFHWALEFPEVFARGGFDAIVGNPPFQGGQRITGALGTNYRDYLVRHVAGGVRGSADLVAYFFLRASRLVREGGGFGLIATNTVAQGDTREVGLEQLTDGMQLHRAVASEPWPGGASLEMATVWARGGTWAGERVLDRAAAAGITPTLTLSSRVQGTTKQLRGTAGSSFQGFIVVGKGFVLDAQQRAAMLAAEPRASEVVKSYMGGEELNSDPAGRPSRWVVDFRDWPPERARRYPGPFRRVEDLVKPERENVNRAQHRERWWQFGETRPALRRALGPLDRCIAMTLHSKSVQPMFASSDIIFSHALVVFAYDDDGHFGLLSSAFHREWAVARASTMRNDIRYTPSDCFETFVQPPLTDEIARHGHDLHAHRSALMLDRQEGLTKTYNRVHDPDESAEDIVRLREIHVALDHAVRDAYGWTDFELGHGHHETRFGTRFTFEPVTRQEVLDRLMELNHARYAEEVAAGLHAKPKAKRKAAPRVARGQLGLHD